MFPVELVWPPFGKMLNESDQGAVLQKSIFGQMLRSHKC